MKKGFTLIELAIALMVIGLILAMAMKGRAVVDAAQINADKNKIGKISTAITTYYTKYGELPGARKITGGSTVDTSANAYIALIDELYLDRPDFVVQSEGGEKYFKIVSCELNSSGYYVRSNTLSAYNNLCLIISSQHPATNGNTNTLASDSLACNLEQSLDDKNLATGDGRAEGATDEDFPAGNVKCDDAEPVTGYTYKIY